MFLAFGVLTFLDNTGSEKDVLMASIDYCEFSIIFAFTPHYKDTP